MPHWLEKGPSPSVARLSSSDSYSNQPLSAPSQLAKDSPGSPIPIGSVLRGRFPPRVSYERFILSSTVYAFLRQFAKLVLTERPSHRQECIPMDVLAARVVVVVRTGVAEVVTVSTCSAAAVARVFATTTAPTTIPSRSAPRLPRHTPRQVPGKVRCAEGPPSARAR